MSILSTLAGPATNKGPLSYEEFRSLIFKFNLKITALTLVCVPFVHSYYLSGNRIAFFSAVGAWVGLLLLLTYRDCAMGGGILFRRLISLYPEISEKKSIWYFLLWLTPLSNFGMQIFLSSKKNDPNPNPRTPLFFRAPILTASLSIALVLSAAPALLRFADAAAGRPISGTSRPRFPSPIAFSAWIGSPTTQKLNTFSVEILNAMHARTALDVALQPHSSLTFFSQLDEISPAASDTGRVLNFTVIGYLHQVRRKASESREPASEVEVETENFSAGLALLSDFTHAYLKPLKQDPVLGSFHPLSFLSPLGAFEIASTLAVDFMVRDKLRESMEKNVRAQFKVLKDGLDRIPLESRAPFESQLQEFVQFPGVAFLLGETNSRDIASSPITSPENAKSPVE